MHEKVRLFVGGVVPALAHGGGDAYACVAQIKILQSTMRKGEGQYQERLQDIRILRLKVRGARPPAAQLVMRITHRHTP